MTNKNASKHSVGIVGVRGYSGLELARILLKHPNAKLAACFATDSKFALSDYLPEESAKGVSVAALADLPAIAPELDTVFLATPAEASLELAPKLLAAGCKVIDLSGAFRLKGADAQATKALYEKWYGFEHAYPELVEQAHYGLVPWSGPVPKDKRLVANPGCYATAALLALLPLVKEKLIRSDTLVIDAKSGASGAGRKAAENLLFTEVEGECLPYKVGAHQHLPEICGYVDKFAAGAIDPLFSTHLLNVRRGIIAGLYARLSEGVSAEQVTKAYERHYGEYPLVRLQAGLKLKQVVGSARAHISAHVDKDKLYVFSLIDNLLKGAASQAVENFNVLHDLPVQLSLTSMEGLL